MADRLGSRERLATLASCRVMDGPPRPHLDRIAELVVSLTGAPVALVSMVDDRRQFFVSQIGLGGAAAAERGTPLSHSLCQYVVITDEPLVLADARLDSELRDHPAVTELGVVAYCGVPIRGPDGQTLGSLCAIDVAPHDWTANDVGLLRALAEAVSAEIDTDARYRQLTIDLHRRLLPVSLPRSDRWDLGVGFQPLHADVGLGGDFYDAVEGRDGSLTLVVGDIVGHDTDAAIAMGQLRAATLALLHHGAPLDEVAATLDRVTRSLPNVFSSAWVAFRIDLDGGRATYLSAGAIPPLVVRADGTWRYLTDASSGTLGVDVLRPSGTTHLDAGDLVVLCSDGLVEARSHGIDHGLERVATTSATRRHGGPAAVAAALLAERRADSPLEDDTTVLTCTFR